MNVSLLFAAYHYCFLLETQHVDLFQALCPQFDSVDISIVAMEFLNLSAMILFWLSLASESQVKATPLYRTGKLSWFICENTTDDDNTIYVS